MDFIKIETQKMDYNTIAKSVLKNIIRITLKGLENTITITLKSEKNKLKRIEKDKVIKQCMKINPAHNTSAWS